VVQVDLLSAEDMEAAVLDAELIRWVADNDVINERKKYEAEAEEINKGRREKGMQEVTWQKVAEDARPDLVVWRINPNIRWFQVQSLPNAVAREILAAAMPNADEMGVAHKYLQLLIPKGLAAQLNDIQNEDWLGTHSMVGRVGRKLARTWKQWILTAPHHSIRYGLNNMIGDLEKAIALAPEMLKGKEEWKNTFEDLWEYFAHAKVSERLRAAVDGGVLAGLTLSEMGDVSVRSHEQFVELHRSLGEKIEAAGSSAAVAKTVAGHLWKLGWGSGRTANEFREAVLRVKAFYHLEGLRGRDAAAYGKVRWASRPEALEGLDGPRRSAKLSRELLGDYGAISVAGEWLRRDLIPFFSWLEVNPTTWGRGLANLWKAPELSAYDKVLRTAPAAGKVAMRMAVVYGLMQLWNRLWLDDEDREKMNEYAKKQGYLAIPFTKDEKGGSRYIRVASGLGDMMEWVGFSQWPELLNDWKRGNIGWLDAAWAVGGKAPLNKIGQGINPFVKGAVEQVSGKSYFPDMFRPRPLGPKDEALAAMWGMQAEYVRWAKDWWTPMPTRGATDWFLSVLGTKYNDPGAAVYGEAKDRAGMFREKVLGQVSGSTDYATPKAQAARMYRLAVKYGDDGAKKRIQARLLAMGVQGREGLKKLLESADPRAGIPKKRWREYEAWMSPEERRIEAQARRYYEGTFRI